LCGHVKQTTNDKDARKRQLEERIVLISRQLEQSKTLVQLFKATLAWPILQGPVTIDNMTGTKHNKDAHVWGFNTLSLSNAYYSSFLII